MKVIDQVKHAYWMVDSDGWIVCSECKSQLPYVLIERATFDRPYSRKEYIDKTDYCPYCGAKMNEPYIIGIDLSNVKIEEVNE